MNEYKEIHEDLKTGIDEFLKSFKDKGDMLKSIGLEATVFSMPLSVYVVDTSGDITFIPTGTKQDPKGVALFKKNKGRIVSVTNLKDYNKLFYIDEFQELLKINKADNYENGFCRGIGPDFETMGYKISSELLMQIINGLQTD